MFSEAQIRNYQLLLSSFSVLNENVRFYDVEAETYNVRVSTPDGILPFEYLSSGFRTIIFIIAGLIKACEYRSKSVPASDFDGLILIDEIELHLHPDWQRRVLDTIRKTF